jgi:peptidoglycan/LPS O-acetylase OafA/YrhL
MDQFLAGMFAARLISAPSFRVVLTRNYLNVLLFVSAGVSLIAFFWWFSANGGLLTFNGEVWPNKSAVFIFLPTIEAVAYAALLLSYLHLPAIPKLSLISKGFSYVGLVSYSIYLDHLLLFPFIFWFIEYLGIVPASWEQSLLLCLLIPIPMLTAAASVTFFMIEKPFMSLRRSKSVASPAHVSPARSEPARLVEVPRVAGTAP